LISASWGEISTLEREEITQLLGARAPILTALRWGDLFVLALLALLCQLGPTHAELAHDLACEYGAAARSISSSVPTFLKFNNKAGEPMLIFWIHPDGTKEQLARLQPGQTYAVDTYVTHTWIMTDVNRHCSKLTIAGTEASEVTVTAPPHPSWPLTQVSYEKRVIQGITVMVSFEFKTRDPQSLDACLTLLSKSVQTIAKAVPVKAFQFFAQITVWLEYEDAMFPRAVYHPSKEYLAEHGRDPRRAGSIQLNRTFEWLTELQPMALLHEFAHAYHHQVLGFDDPTIIDAYEKARASGRYDNVARNTGGRERAYAMENEREFFAELTEAYFGTNDYFPFTRGELWRFDRHSYQTIEGAWYRP
jgi:hypothetical protein